MQNFHKKIIFKHALEEFEEMVDDGSINEAENILLESIDYAKKRTSCRNLILPNL